MLSAVTKELKIASKSTSRNWRMCRIYVNSKLQWFSRTTVDIFSLFSVFKYYYMSFDDHDL